MKIIEKIKNIILLIWNSKFLIYSIRKPVNTFFPFLNPESEKADAEIWSTEKHYKTSQYQIMDANAEFFIDYVQQKTSKKDHIFDICCNQGRFLIALEKIGYANLSGVDIMCSAIEVLKSYKSENGFNISAECALVQDKLRSMDAKSIDYAITFSATLELINPRFDIFHNLARICRKGFIFALNESGHKYPRFYRYLAARNGFRLVNVISMPGSALKILHYEF